MVEKQASEKNIELSVEHACEFFGALKAVNDVSMKVRQGERLIIIGTNGAGKTTLFNLIAGDLKLTSGKIVLFGKDVTNKLPRERARMGLRRTYQTSAVFNSMTVRENLYMSLLGECSPMKWLDPFHKIIQDKDMMAKVEQCAESILLKDDSETKAINLSHGQRRQLELGQALIVEPRMILFDEPSSGLSAEEREMMQKTIMDLDMSRLTLIMIEHDMDIAFAVADKIMVMFDGCLIAEGSPAEIRENSQVKEIYLGGRFDDKSNS